MKIKKQCKCGRIFYDTDNKKKCPLCAEKNMKKFMEYGTIAIGGAGLGYSIGKNKGIVIKVAKTIGKAIKR